MWCCCLLPCDGILCSVTTREGWCQFPAEMLQKARGLRGALNFSSQGGKFSDISVLDAVL